MCPQLRGSLVVRGADKIVGAEDDAIERVLSSLELRDDLVGRTGLPARARAPARRSRPRTLGVAQEPVLDYLRLGDVPATVSKES